MAKFLKIYILAIVFLFNLSAILFFPLAMEAATISIPFDPQVDIGAYKGGDITETSIGEYIKAIYVYAISAVGILAAFMIMFNAFNWVISAGNQEKIKEAQSKIVAALSGLVLVLFAYALFSFINPDLVNFKSIDPREIKPEEDAVSGCCEWPDGAVTASDEDYCTSEKGTFFANAIPGETKCLTTCYYFRWFDIIWNTQGVTGCYATEADCVAGKRIDIEEEPNDGCFTCSYSDSNCPPQS